MPDLLTPLLGHDPGGTRIPIPPGVTVCAIYDGPADCYRYMLDWIWDATRPTLVAGLMNPSCAGHDCGDRTLGWLYRWSVRNGFGRQIVVNADAYRAADQARLAEASDPCGPHNEAFILRAAAMADLVVLGYGLPKVKAVRSHGPRMAATLARAGVKLHVWATCADGTPKHPLYLPGVVGVREWSAPDA